MPSWNIHTAHVERLLRDHTAAELGIRNVNSFLFGNFVPDVYVGYMVENPTRTIDYRETHFADPHQMPEPDYQAFWDLYAAPSADEDGRVSDLVLGAWVHLMADCTYNHHANELIRTRGLVYGDPLRVRKQRDFDLFGHTLKLSLVPQVTDDLLDQCASFPQYPIAEKDVRAAVAVAAAIVDDVNARHIEAEPDYSLLSSEFFSTAADEANDLMASSLRAYAAGLV